jgi:hypothetical protein
MTNRYIEQAKLDYEGKPIAIAEHWDKYDEHHVIVKMQSGKDTYYLDWIGGKYADEPDEFDVKPFTNLKWKAI